MLVKQHYTHTHMRVVGRTGPNSFRQLTCRVDLIATEKCLLLIPYKPSFKEDKSNGKVHIRRSFLFELKVSVDSKTFKGTMNDISSFCGKFVCFHKTVRLRVN